MPVKQPERSSWAYIKRSTEGRFQANLKIEMEDIQNVTEQRTALHKLFHCLHTGSPPAHTWQCQEQACPVLFTPEVCVCAQPRGTSETLGSDVPQGGPKSVALFQSGLVSPVTLYLHTHTHTHICYSKPVILSRQEFGLKSREGRHHLRIKSNFNVLLIF